MTLSKIVPFRPPGPTRSNSIRTSQYQTKLDRQAGFRRSLVKRLEDALFADQGHTSVGERVPFVPAQMTFTCCTGVIKYFYCREKKSYLLTDFSLGDGGNGGQPISVDPDESSYHVAAAVGWARNLAARWAFSVIRLVAHAMLKARLLSVPPLFPRPMTEWLTRVRSANTAILREIAVLGRVMNSAQSDICPDALPSWSILRHSVTTAQQLDNYYARSILAGEALTRLGAEVDLGLIVTRCQYLAEQDEDDDLLDESTAVIDALVNRPISSGSPRTLRCLTTRFLFDRDLLADDRRLRLIRSEMTLRIAASLARRSAYLVRVAGNARQGDANLRHRAELMHKYARLSEFVRLSNVYFGTLHCVGSDLSILEDLGDVDATDLRQVGCLVSGLTEFGTAATTLVYLMTNAEESSSDSESMADLRGRLISLASEILALAK